MGEYLAYFEEHFAWMMFDEYYSKNLFPFNDDIEVNTDNDDKVSIRKKDK